MSKYKSAAVNLVVVRGAPGIGKTTLAKNLSDSFYHGTIIERDIVGEMVMNLDWFDKESMKKVEDTTIALAKSHFDHGYSPIIITSVFRTWEIDYFLDQIKGTKLESSFLVVTLTVDEDVLWARLNNPDTKNRNKEDALKCNEEIIKGRYENEIRIDTSDLNPLEVALIVIDAIRGSKINTN